MGQSSSLTTQNLNPSVCNMVLVSIIIQDRRKTYFTNSGVESLYDLIARSRDYRRIKRWNDSKYEAHLPEFIRRQEWEQFKSDILNVTAQHDAKREKLRKLVEFNRYRSLFSMFWIVVSKCVDCNCNPDPLHDPTCCVENISVILFLSFFPFSFVALMFFLLLLLPLCYVFCWLIDCICFVRFVLFRAEGPPRAEPGRDRAGVPGSTHTASGRAKPLPSRSERSGWMVV
jgi:hypothetical protein